uniref:NHR domain-containing protein n=1 Tax=Heterorhabditis bacteriophora TaxID=37862 RepID=A0A1I7XQL6_HETBA
MSASKALPTEKGSLIGVYFERKMGITRVHVMINGSDLCPDFRGIPLDQPLFAVVDVFGNTKEVTLEMVRVVVPEPRTPDRLTTLCSERVHCLVREGRCSTTRLPVPLRNRMQEEEHERHYQLQESGWAREMQEYWLRQRL